MHGSGDIRRCRQSADGNDRHCSSKGFGIFQRLVVLVRADSTGRDPVYGDVVLRKLDRLLFQQGRQPPFGRAEGAVPPAPEAERRAHRKQVDVTAASATGHLLGGDSVLE